MEVIENTPIIRFREFKERWQQKKLGMIIDALESGVSVNSIDKPISKPYEKGILKTSCISSGRFNKNENKTIIEGDISRARLNPSKNTILISRMNSPQLVGESGHVDMEYPDLYIPDRIWRAKINKVLADSKFVSFILSSQDMMGRISNIATGTSGSMKNISKPNFLSLDIFLPPLQEQQKIASFLIAVDDKIQLLNKKKISLEKYKKGVMQQIFNQKIRFKDDNGKGYPAWESKRAGHIFKNHSNKKHKGDLPILAITQEYGAVLRNSIGIDIQSSEASILSYKIVEKGDFIISLRSFQGGIEYSNVLGICSPAYTILKPIVGISTLFFKYYLKKDSFIQQLSNSVVGIRDGKQISFDVFSGMKLSYPSVEEQTKIANFLSSLDDKINFVNQQITQTKHYKKGLLQQMFV